MAARCLTDKTEIKGTSACFACFADLKLCAGVPVGVQCPCFVVSPNLSDSLGCVKKPHNCIVEFETPQKHNVVIYALYLRFEGLFLEVPSYSTRTQSSLSVLLTWRWRPGHGLGLRGPWSRPNPYMTHICSLPSNIASALQNSEVERQD